MTEMNPDIRWKQRFQNFDRAVVLLREPLERGVENLSLLEKEGVARRFGAALQSAWKTLKDYLQYQGMEISPVTPRSVIKAAFSAKTIGDGQVWIDMIDHRNLLSHTYDRKVFEQAVDTLHTRYLTAFEELHEWFVQRMID
jgi:nucleotidyltransferase substrate binding protein (TIGR01987 family)